MPWGDYGAILLSGMVTRPDDSGRVGVERTGPFVPPITIAGISTPIVTEDFRATLADSDLAGVSFRAANKRRIVRLDWTSWDRTAPEPQRYPAGGEPENYILGRKHDEALANEIGPLWELVLDHTLDNPGDADIIRKQPTNFTRILVSDRARTWLSSHAAEWIMFTPDD